jgi:hypothetical protein
MYWGAAFFLAEASAGLADDRDILSAIDIQAGQKHGGGADHGQLSEAG